MFKGIGTLIVIIAAVIALAGCTGVTPSLAPSSAAPPAAALFAADTGITVSGMGRVRVKPNVANATIGIEVVATSLAEASAQANSKMSAVIEKIKSMGVADKDIQTTNYSVNPITQPSRQGETPRITGYRINNQVSVTVRKLDDLGKILDAAVAAGANSIYGISFSVDDPKPHQEQARAAAVKEAQDKAATLAKAGNVTLGKIVWMNEGVAQPRPLLRAATSLAVAESVPIETGELEIVVSVEVRFTIQ